MIDLITKDTLFLLFSILSLTFSLIGIILATYAAINVIALSKATHTVQYVPIDNEIDKENELFLQSQKVEDAPLWATTEESIKAQERMYNEELEEEMPDLARSDDDKKVFSF